MSVSVQLTRREEQLIMAPSTLVRYEEVKVDEAGRQPSQDRCFVLALHRRAQPIQQTTLMIGRNI
jgi:hypothetical protein